MNRPFSASLAAAALLLCLTACGGDKTAQNDAQSSDHSQNSTAVTPGQDDHTVTAPDTNPGNPSTEDPIHDDLITGVPLDEMLDNANVHDQDGDLLDGENSMTPGTDIW